MLSICLSNNFWDIFLLILSYDNTDKINSYYIF